LCVCEDKNALKIMLFFSTPSMEKKIWLWIRGRFTSIFERSFKAEDLVQDFLFE
jgi:hypothetical protein